ncbi:MAG: DUF2461 domain-containing protein [Saprospiraceae bacterium]|nr:DUF2461 domain-containing protein [Saprospiraceae bacterium]MBK7221230.1 DUF2461 domain-containing protein [Saprospiraceae bacterium]MBK7790019.1 DUF2461 domain-containing protein [Saprospiraceae bacterium]MBK8850694.1 DUF2461 domain-containing protein [Saprospiraceae bacterium]
MKIDKKLLGFLSQLQHNNNKEWFEANKETYVQQQDAFKQFCEEIFKSLGKTDQLEATKVFRIYRDVRFSKDKTPYKNNFGASFSRIKPYFRGGYYLHIEPGNSFAGGGFWDPAPNDLKRIREEIAADAKPLKKIQANKTFQSYFTRIEGDQLKTMPKGFTSDLEGEDLIRRKQYLVMRKFSDKEILAENFSGEVVSTFKAMRPLFDYMTLVLTTDHNGESVL